MPTITIVGLTDKVVAESCERVRAALSSIGLALPSKRIAVNLAPADVVKDGAHCANAQLQPDQLADIINFDENAALLLKTAVEQSHLSARAHHKTQRVACTIADLNAEAIISRSTIAEALAYRAMPLVA